jgi:hypothetical protein
VRSIVLSVMEGKENSETARVSAREYERDIEKRRCFRTFAVVKRKEVPRYLVDSRYSALDGICRW